MNRKDFLKGTGMAGLGLILPKTNLSANTTKKSTLVDCTLIPTETAGPFPLDLTANSDFLRQDVREDREGAQLNLRMKIIGLDNCEPVPNVRVNIWHCDKDGNYSGYQSQQGLTYLRGYQMADANGEVEFITVFPGWYNGRTCHIHFQVYVSETYAAISQLTFDHDLVNGVYDDFSSLYTKGDDPLSPDTDNIFNDGYDLQLASLTPNSTTGGYDAYLEVTVQGIGTVGVSNLERQTAKIFELGQNAPNPFINQTFIPVTVKEKSDIKLELWNINGKKVSTVFEQDDAFGEFNIEVNLNKLGLPIGNYIYQFEAVNNKGTFRLPKLMTVQK